MHNNVRFYNAVNMGHIERKKREKENIRTSILEAALTIAKSEGWKAVTIRKIAKAIEYTSPIVYEYFKNKDDLFWEIILLGFRKLLQQGEAKLELVQNPKEKLLALSLAHWDFAFENRELYSLMFNLERPYPNEEAQKGIALIDEIFQKVSGATGEEVNLLVFNWLCLLNGTIGMIMQFESADLPYEEKFSVPPRSLFIKFLQRFIDSISMK